LLHYLAEKHDVVLFLQGNAATELRCGGKFQSALRRRLFLSTMPKESSKSDSNHQSCGDKF